MRYFEFDQPAALSCPLCAGTLRETKHGAYRQYTCHIGHVLTPKTLFDEQAVLLETRLSSCLSLLNERAAFCRDMAEWAREHGQSPTPSELPSAVWWDLAEQEAKVQAEKVEEFFQRERVQPYEHILAGPTHNDWVSSTS